MGELPCVNHRQRAGRAPIDAEAASDAEVLVEEQHRLLLGPQSDVVGACDGDAVRWTHVDAETAQNAQLGRERDVVEAAEATQTFEPRLLFVIAGLDFAESDAPIGRRAALRPGMESASTTGPRYR